MNSIVFIIFVCQELNNKKLNLLFLATSLQICKLCNRYFYYAPTRIHIKLTVTDDQTP